MESRYLKMFHLVSLCDYFVLHRTSKGKWPEMEETTVFTFDGSPLCFSAQQPPPIDLILLVTAHHSKRDYLLFNSAV